MLTTTKIALDAMGGDNAPFEIVKGAIDAGMSIPCSEDVFPSADRMTGKHIAEYGKTKKFKKDPADIESKFKAVKDSISKGK